MHRGVGARKVNGAWRPGPLVPAKLDRRGGTSGRDAARTDCLRSSLNGDRRLSKSLQISERQRQKQNSRRLMTSLGQASRFSSGCAVSRPEVLAGRPSLPAGCSSKPALARCSATTTTVTLTNPSARSSRKLAQSERSGLVSLVVLVRVTLCRLGRLHRRIR